MKPKYRASRLASSLASVIFAGVALSTSAQAAVYYWDNDGTTAGYGTAGGT